MSHFTLRPNHSVERMPRLEFQDQDSGITLPVKSTQIEVGWVALA